MAMNVLISSIIQAEVLDSVTFNLQSFAWDLALVAAATCIPRKIAAFVLSQGAVASASSYSATIYARVTSNEIALPNRPRFRPKSSPWPAPPAEPLMRIYIGTN